METGNLTRFFQYHPIFLCLLVTSLYWPATADFGSSLNPPRLIRRLGGRNMGTGLCGGLGNLRGWVKTLYTLYPL
jgi:hypothetical protein